MPAKRIRLKARSRLALNARRAASSSRALPWISGPEMAASRLDPIKDGSCEGAEVAGRAPGLLYLEAARTCMPPRDVVSLGAVCRLLNLADSRRIAGRAIVMFCSDITGMAPSSSGEWEVVLYCTVLYCY